METEGCVLVCKQTACVKMCLYSEAPRTASENNKLWMNCSYQPCAASHHWRGTSKYHMPNYNQTHHLSQLPQLRLSSHTVVVPAMKSWGRKTQSGILRFPAAAVSQQNTAGIKKKSDAIPAVALHGRISDGGFRQHTLTWLKRCFDMEVINKTEDFFFFFTRVSLKHILQDSCIARGAESSARHRYQCFTSACPTRNTFLNSQHNWSACFQLGGGGGVQAMIHERSRNQRGPHTLQFKVKMSWMSH